MKRKLKNIKKGWIISQKSGQVVPGTVSVVANNKKGYANYAISYCKCIFKNSVCTCEKKYSSFS